VLTVQLAVFRTVEIQRHNVLLFPLFCMHDTSFSQFTFILNWWHLLHEIPYMWDEALYCKMSVVTISAWQHFNPEQSRCTQNDCNSILLPMLCPTIIIMFSIATFNGLQNNSMHHILTYLHSAANGVSWYWGQVSWKGTQWDTVLFH